MEFSFYEGTHPPSDQFCAPALQEAVKTTKYVFARMNTIIIIFVFLTYRYVFGNDRDGWTFLRLLVRT